MCEKAATTHRTLERLPRDVLHHDEAPPVMLAELRVESEIHGTHAARAKRALDPIPTRQHLVTVLAGAFDTAILKRGVVDVTRLWCRHQTVPPP
jgi:hypothetical protein